MTDDAETTRRALAFLTIAHESFQDSGPTSVEDIDLGLVLGDEHGEIDWKDMAMGMVVVAYLLLETVPKILIEEMGEKWETPPERLTPTELLRFISLSLSKMDQFD